MKIDFDGLSKKFVNEYSPYTHKGRYVPRVTEIISKCSHEDSIVRWANKIGLHGEEYGKVMKGYCNYGTTVHKTVEMYLKTGKIDLKCPQYPIRGFEKWWAFLKNNSDELIVKGQEFPLTCPWFGGTADLLLYIDGEYILVDFKTSNRISYKYSLQLAAYAYMLKYNKICDVDRIMVLKLSKVNDFYETFQLNMKIKNERKYMYDCMNTFLSMAHTYWMNRYVEKNFSKIKKNKRPL